MGWVLALVAGLVVGAVEGNVLVEITLTTILAYVAFYRGGHVLGMSGVMSVVAAGLVIGGWGRAKISHSVSEYLNSYWDYLAGLANWLIFVRVGLTVVFQALVDSLPILLGVVVAMFLSRALAIYTLLPLATRLSGGEPIDRGYQTVIPWGGVRGGVALALLDTIEDRELLVSLTTGARRFGGTAHAERRQGGEGEGVVVPGGGGRPCAAPRLGLDARSRGRVSTADALGGSPTTAGGSRERSRHRPMVTTSTASVNA